jgi:hypothetical protein
VTGEYKRISAALAARREAIAEVDDPAELAREAHQAGCVVAEANVLRSEVLERLARVRDRGACET